MPTFTHGVRLPIKTLALCVVIGLLAGCPTPTPSLDPRINDVVVGDVVQGETPEVNVTMVLPGAANKRVRRITAEFRSTLEPNRPFIFHDGDFTGSGNDWSGTLPALNLGAFEVKVNVTLRTGPDPSGDVQPPIDEIIVSDVVSFNVSADSVECFNFGSVTDDTLGWSHDGYKLVATGEPVSACSEEAIWFNGMLTALFGANCLPQEQFHMDLVSPDVSARQGWSQSQGVVVTAGFNVPQMQMQPILERAGDANPYAHVDEAGDFVFFSMTNPAGGLQTFRAPMNIPDGAVNALRVRFFGAPMSTGNEGFARIGVACPIPDRPG